MYHSYFGFSETPFNLTPDPRYLYLSGYHKEALDHLLYGINERKGFISVTGGIGTGKTTLCRALLRQLGDGYKTALIFNSFITDMELLQQINQEFGIHSQRVHKSKKEIIDDLNAFLLENFSRGGNALVLIDEAQNLPHPVLEQLRMLSNLETEREKLLQIILVGQPELAELLTMPSLRQLGERITVRYHLKPLGRRDAAAYVEHRIAVAGGSGKVRFTGSALSEVHRFSGGNPRRINSVCDRALLMAYARETFVVKRSMVRDAVKDLRGGISMEFSKTGQSVFWKQALFLFFLLLIFVGLLWQGHELVTGYLSTGPDRKTSIVGGIDPAAPVESKTLDVESGIRGSEGTRVSGPVPESAKEEGRHSAGGELSENGFYLDGSDSVAALLRLYEGIQVPEEEINLRLVHFKVPPEFQLLFRRPFRVKVDSAERDPGQANYLVALSQNESGALLLDKAGSERRVGRDFMFRHWSSDVSWFVSGDRTARVLSAGTRSQEVLAMQRNLHSLGYRNEMNGSYGEKTVEAVRYFQRDTGLRADGLAGPRTLTLLDMMIPAGGGAEP